MALKMKFFTRFLFITVYFYQHFYLTIGQTFVTEYPRPETTLEYCSFFNNRAPQAQPGLKNCTWFCSNSCCQQQEIEATFGVVKPLKGASLKCQRYINYLMCYICAPNQNLFYQKERLTVCETFCDSLYEACQDAFLKGNRIADLYPSGKEFCISRRFLVGNSNCFRFDITLDKKINAGRKVQDASLLGIVPFILASYWLLTALNEFIASGILWKTLEKTAHIACRCRLSRRMVEMRAFILAALVISTFGNAAGDSEPVQVLSSDDVKVWADRLSRDLHETFNNDLAFSELKQRFHDISSVKGILDRNSELQKLKIKLENYFFQKKRVVEETAARISRLHDELVSETDLDVAKSVDDLSSAIFLDANRLYSYHLKEPRNYSSLLGRKVIWNQSVVKLPDSINRKTKEIIVTVEWTAKIDAFFKENKRNYPELKWQYFASDSGIFRLYPGAEWKRNFIGYPEDFEPRMQPWYVNLKRGARNIVVIVDASASMKDSGFQRLKDVTRTILASLGYEHNVAVIESSSNAWDNEGKNMSGAANIIGCRKNGLFPATTQRREELIVAVQQLRPKGGSDHLPAFRLAFDLLKSHQTFDKEKNDCDSLIIFVTDGKLDEDDVRCSPGFHRYAEDNRKAFQAGNLCEFDPVVLSDMVSLMQLSLPGSKARIFTFLTSVSKRLARPDLQLPGRLACENNGAMSKVLLDDEDSGIYDQMKPYFRYIETTSTISSPVLTGIYVSQINDAPVLTVSAAVISNSTKNRIGVFAIDILMSEIEDELRSVFIDNGDVFMMNLIDGTAVVHPLAKHSYEIDDFTPHVFISELETEDDVLEDFHSILQKMMDGLSGDAEITRKARKAVLHDGLLFWRPVESVHYYFTNISGTSFGIVTKFYSDNEERTNNDKELETRTSYLHSILTSSSVDPVVKSAQLELAASSAASKYYTSVNVSLRHSVIGFSPEAFCQSSSFPDQFGTGIPEIQKALEGTQSVTNCIITPAARKDVSVTLGMENEWINRKSNTTIDVVASTFVVTSNGVIRLYPGVALPRDDLLIPNLEPWYTKAVLNAGRLSLTPPYFSHRVPDVVVTLSAAVFDDLKCNSTTFDLLCNASKVVAVGGIDIDEMDLTNVIYASLSTSASLQALSERSCNKKYPCFSNSRKMCLTKCLLINDVGEIVVGLPKSVARQRPVSLSVSYRYVVDVLKKNRIFVPRKNFGYQATCLESGEVLNDGSQGYRFPFEVRHSCIEEKSYFEVNRNRLVAGGGIFSHSLEDDPCHSGIFFLVALAQTDSLLLIFDDFQDFTTNGTSKACRRMLSDSSMIMKRFDGRPCPTNTTYGKHLKESSCQPTKKYITLPCGYNASIPTTAAAATSSLLICIVLTFLYLID